MPAHRLYKNIHKPCYLEEENTWTTTSQPQAVYKCDAKASEGYAKMHIEQHSKFRREYIILLG